MTNNSTIERLLYITLFMVFLGVGVVVFILVGMLNSSGKTSKDIQQAVKELKADKEIRDRQILSHIDCIGLLLQQPNRAALHIEDLQNCKISEAANEASGQVAFSANPSSPDGSSAGQPARAAGPTPTPAPSTKPPTSTPAPTPPQAPPVAPVPSLAQRIVTFLQQLL